MNSCKQPTVALSLTEAEYMALIKAAKEAIWLCFFLAELDYINDKLSFIYGNNQESIKLSCNPHHHSRTNTLISDIILFVSALKAKTLQ